MIELIGPLGKARIYKEIGHNMLTIFKKRKGTWSWSPPAYAYSQATAVDNGWHAILPDKHPQGVRR